MHRLRVKPLQCNTTILCHKVRRSLYGPGTRVRLPFSLLYPLRHPGLLKKKKEHLDTATGNHFSDSKTQRNLVSSTSALLEPGRAALRGILLDAAKQRNPQTQLRDTNAPQIPRVYLQDVSTPFKRWLR